MLRLKIPPLEAFNSETSEFVEIKPSAILQLEHSLLSISKWEAKWGKPFLSPEEKTLTEVIDYIRCMTINKSVDKSVYDRLTKKHISIVHSYMISRHSAHVMNQSKDNSLYTPTSEDLYYSMFYYGFPIECERWHFGNLMALLDIARAKNTPVKKMTQRELNAYYAELNAQRCAELGSKG